MLRFVLALLFTLTLPLPALADTVIANSTFLGGLYGTWAINYPTGPAGLYLQQVTIDIGPTNLAFDTAPGGFGSLGSEDVTPTNGTDVTTGLTSIAPSGPGLDGGTLVTFTFDDFTPGDSFTFGADVDNPNPTLIPLEDCTGKKGLALAACDAFNVAAIATNTSRLLAAQTVLSDQMAGAVVNFQFGGPATASLSLSGAYQPLTLSQIAHGVLSVTATATPEPGTVCLTALGLLLIARRLFWGAGRLTRGPTA